MSLIDPVQEAYESFRKGLDSGRMAHAYIVVGPPRSHAREFALKALATLYRDAAGRSPNLEVHPDIMWIEPEKKSRVISVDQIRDVCRRLARTSFEGGLKSCVIVGADRLNDEASNAFLKTLEEPSGRSMFLLLTDLPEGLLPTIVSRCQRIVVTNVHDSLPEEYRRDLAVILSDGDDSETMAGIVPARRVAAILEVIKKTIEKQVEKEVAAEMEAKKAGDEDADLDEDIVNARVSTRYREIRSGFLRFIILWYRDILMSVFGVDEKHLYNREFMDQIHKGAIGLSSGSAIRKVEAAETMKEQLERNLDEVSVLSTGFYSLVRR